MRPDSHEIYSRRRSRNVGLGLVLAAFILLTFGLTMVKISQTPNMACIHQKLAS